MEKVASFSLIRKRYIFLDWGRKVDKNKLNGLIKVWALVNYKSGKDGISLPSGEYKCALHLIAIRLDQCSLLEKGESPSRIRREDARLLQL